jgi:hypothetical protein
MIRTEVVWSPDEPTQEVLFAILSKAGPADPVNPINRDGVTPVHVIRSWPDLAAAQEWIDFINQYNPISAVILTD